MEIEITFETKLFFDATVWQIGWCIRDTLSLCSNKTLIIIVSFIKTKTTFDICREIAAMPVVLITKPWKLFCQCHFWMNILAGICVDVGASVCVCAIDKRSWFTQMIRTKWCCSMYSLELVLVAHSLFIDVSKHSHTHIQKLWHQIYRLLMHSACVLSLWVESICHAKFAHRYFKNDSSTIIWHHALKLILLFDDMNVS